MREAARQGYAIERTCFQVGIVRRATDALAWAWSGGPQELASAQYGMPSGEADLDPGFCRRRLGEWYLLQRLLVVALLGAGLAACATLPPSPPLGKLGLAEPPHPGGPLEKVERHVSAEFGPTRSGFNLLTSNEDGLRWRLALIDSAQHTLDLQYYVWWGDESGVLLMNRVVDAAERGVKVRLILDDLSTILNDESHPKLRDQTMALLNSHPNIEIRLFNAWHQRGIAGRGVEMLTQMERINHRMHNKQIIADNRATIIGGRNLGNEYFGLSPEFNFLDLDVIGVGPVARQASGIFDEFWNSDWVIPTNDLGITESRDDLMMLADSIHHQLEAAGSLRHFAIDPQNWDQLLADIQSAMRDGTSAVHSDSPDPGTLTHHMPSATRELLGSAHREILIVNAYLIPDPQLVELLGDMSRRGVRVRILTNSLASHDVPAVNSHYKAWRKPLIEAGVDLYEIRHDAARQHELADTPPTVAEFMGLHIKAIVIDRQRLFVGSMNLDPRSSMINSEMGTIIFSPALAQDLEASLEQDLQPENAWRVTLADDGSLRWTSSDETLDEQPARNSWQRLEDLVFMAFPRDLY